MSNHIGHILSEWKEIKDDREWALGAIIHTEGPVYRKIGALMLLSSMGDQLGMLSGGCLEGDILLQSQRALIKNESTRVTYDSNEEGGLAWRLGIGCGGLAEILIHPCNHSNNHLQLEQLHEQLNNQSDATYKLNLDAASATLVNQPKPTRRPNQSCQLTATRHANELEIYIPPTPHLVISGAGIDMQPLAALASQLGWKVTLIDRRQANARRRHFPQAEQVFCCDINAAPNNPLNHCDALIIANHNLDMDAAALKAAQSSSARYIGLLGPSARRQKVFELAGLSEKNSKAVSGPMGLALGNDLPESVALSVLAECHAVLFGSTAKPLSNHYL